MFQVINHLNIPFLIFLLPFLLGAVCLWGAPVADLKACQLQNVGLPEDYYLSRGFQEQREGFHNSDKGLPAEAKKHHEASVSFFEKFHACRKELNEAPTYLSALSTATSFLELGDLESAFKWSDVAYKMFESPRSPPRENILLKTRILLRKGELAPAEAILERDLSVYPYDTEFLFYLGNINYDLKHWNHSLLYFTALAEVIQKRDTNSKFRSVSQKFLGDLNYRLDYPRKSIQHYVNYLHFVPNDSETLSRIAQIYYGLGEFANSKSYLNLVRNINQREIDASLMLGEMYFLDSRSLAPGYFEILNKEKKIPREGIIYFLYRYLKGDTVGLENDLVSFIEKNPNRLSSKVLLADIISGNDLNRKYAVSLSAGDLAFQYRQYKTAENYFKRALVIAESSLALAKDLVTLYEKLSQSQEAQGLNHHAILSMRKALEINKDRNLENSIHFRLAYLLMSPSIKKTAEALEISKMLISRDDKQASYHYINGLIYTQVEDFISALTAFNKALEIDPKNSNYLFYAALSNDKLKDFPNTEKSLLLAIEVNPEGQNSYNYLGYLYAEKGIKKEESKTLLIKAVGLEPDNAAYQDSLGWIYFKLDQYSDSLLHLHFAEQLSFGNDGEDPVIYDHLGDVYRKKNDLVKANLYWLKAIPLSKDPEELKKIKSKLMKVQKELSE